jgi:hypothetical protein
MSQAAQHHGPPKVSGTACFSSQKAGWPRVFASVSTQSFIQMKDCICTSYRLSEAGVVLCGIIIMIPSFYFQHHLLISEISTIREGLFCSFALNRSVSNLLLLYSTVWNVVFLFSFSPNNFLISLVILFEVFIN